MLLPRIVLYGPSKIGISSFCATIPNAFFMDVGRSIEHLKTEGQRCLGLEDCRSVIDMLGRGNHLYTTLVIDNLDGLENALMKEVFNDEYTKRSPQIGYFEEIPYGRGYSMVIEELKGFLYELDNLRISTNLNIIITAHETLETHYNPFSGPIRTSRVHMVSKSARAQVITEEASTVLTNWADAVLYIAQQNHIRGQFYGKKNCEALNLDPQERRIYTERRPGFEAGNRFNLPYELLLDWEELQAQINKNINKNLRISINKEMEKK